MKIIIEIPEKTNAHIRSDYGHGVRGLRIEDMEMLVDAVYHGEPYHVRPRGEWIFVHPLQEDDGGAYMCSICKMGDWNIRGDEHFCPNCGADMRKEGGEK